MNNVQSQARDQIDEKCKLNLSELFDSEAAWSAELSAIKRDSRNLYVFQGKLSDGAPVVAEALELVFSLKERESKVFAYAQFSHFVDTNDQKAAANYQSAQALRSNLQSAISFVEPELLRLDMEILHRLPEGDSRLGIYQHYFDDLVRRRPYVLSDALEDVLANLSGPFAGPEAIATTFLSNDIVFDDAISSDGQTISVTPQTIGFLVESADVQLRRSAEHSYVSGLQNFKNTLATTLLTSVKQSVFKSKLRGYPSSLEAVLFEDNLGREIFENVIACTRRNLTVWHRYWNLRKKALALETYTPADICVPLSKEEPRFPYNEGLDIICESLAPLGEDYISVLRNGCLDWGWVDVYPTPGKFSGWMSSDEPGGPPYIILHYTDSLLDLSAFAHELGHSMHSYYSSQSQPMAYRSYSSLVGEVPSNLNQALLRAHLLESHSDRETRLAVINEAMWFLMRYLLVMPTLAEFELEVHNNVEQGKGMSADELVEMFAELYSPAYGDQAAYKRDEIGVEWAGFLHLYTPFYTFKYTLAIAASYAIASRFLSGDPDAASDFVRFLKAGSSLYPVEALKLAGIDITDPGLIESAYPVISDMLDELEVLL